MFPPYAKIVGRKTTARAAADGEAPASAMRREATGAAAEVGKRRCAPRRTALQRRRRRWRRHMPYMAPLHSYINNVIPMHTAHNLAASKPERGARVRGMHMHTRVTPGPPRAYVPVVVSPKGHVCVTVSGRTCAFTALARLAFVTLLNSCFEVALRRARVTRGG